MPAPGSDTSTPILRRHRENVIRMQPRLMEPIAALKGQMPSHQALLDSLERAETVLHGIRVEAQPIALDHSPADSPFREGFPLVALRPERIDGTLFSRAVRALAAAFEVDLAGANLAPLLSHYLEFDYVNRWPDQREYEILSLVHLGVKPQLERTAEMCRELLGRSTFPYGHCPICGGRPYISEIRGQERLRYLHCGLCGADWNFPRLECPFCQTRDAAHLGYFTIKGQESCRVDTCEKCKGFLKNIERPGAREKQVMAPEDLITIHFDLKALDVGYRKFTPHYLGFLL